MLCLKSKTREKIRVFSIKFTLKRKWSTDGTLSVILWQFSTMVVPVKLTFPTHTLFISYSDALSSVRLGYGPFTFLNSHTA